MLIKLRISLILCIFLLWKILMATQFKLLASYPYGICSNIWIFQPKIIKIAPEDSNVWKLAFLASLTIFINELWWAYAWMASVWMASIFEWQLSRMASLPNGNWVEWQLSRMASVRMATVSEWQVSEWQLSSNGKCPNGNCLRMATVAWQLSEWQVSEWQVGASHKAHPHYGTSI